MALKGFLHDCVLLVAVVAGCTATITTGTPGTCSPDSTVAGCTGTSVGYSCTGSETPELTNASLNCSVGVPRSPGSSGYLYCCETLAAITCARDTTVTTCVNGTIGYSCTGSDTPAQSDPSLTCGSGASGNAGETLYCCASGADAGGSCSPSGASGCLANSTEYSCSGSATPPQGNPSLTCGPGIAGGGNATLYCCVAIDAATPPSSDASADVGTAGDVGTGADAVIGTDVGTGADAGACSVLASTGSSGCDQCLDAQCCSALVSCDTPDDAGVNDAGASACEQLLGCIRDCIVGNADAGVAPGTLSECQPLCSPAYTSSEQQNASALLQCQASSCSQACP